MSAPPSPTRFEPEVLALLDEIARSPEGRLLHVPRERLRTYFGDPKETLTPHGSFLSKAERHLITAYREQAARVLLEACIGRLREDPLVIASRDVNAAELRRTAARLPRRFPEESEASRSLDALAEGTALSSTELAVAAVRMSPSDLAFNALAVSYQKEQWLGSSLEVLSRFLRGGVSSQQRAQGLGNIGSVHAQRARFDLAFDFAWKAFLMDGSSRFAAWALADALQGGLEKEARLSAEQLDQCEDAWDFDGLLDGIRAAKRNGAWSPTTTSTRLIPRIREGMGSRSGAICDAFS